MAVPDHSSLSTVCRAIADFVKDEIDFGEATVNVTLGNPENGEPTGQGNSGHGINLFFYRFEPSGFQSGVLPGETWMVRGHCLITPFGVDEGQKSAGEIDLRLLGEIMRLFHEQPITSIDIEDEDGDTQTFQLQTVCEALSMEELSQLWGTQGSVIYRPSVAYEIDLAPIIPLEKAVEAPLVGAWGVDIHSNTDDARYADASGDITQPVVAAKTPNTNIESWAPVACFVHSSACAETLSFELGGPALAGFQRKVWVAGDVGTDIDFYWEVWDSVNGWRTLAVSDSTTVPSESIDPENIDSGALFTVSAPVEDGSNIFDQAGQAVLYAQRTYKRAAEGDSGPDYTARSNPLLVSIYAG